ncbi:hypothetical protein B0T21DRAFT_48645 [Apiosordaria backusii]|uniref:GPI inositol-deacylase n=1 Tax=Apiosordaria backusii TaxID=314023 RepID=A0AA40ASH0_9PEZI|nr:hypothetical protein B0T21DRAFT_48645 [Apiosordaria backusii]
MLQNFRTSFHVKPPPPEQDPLGLTLIHGADNVEGDIIFVHGLGGSSRKTWSWNRDPNIFWPSWLHHEEGLSQYRVFSFGYNANFRESGTPLSILDFSKSLLVRMKAYGKGRDDSAAIGLRPIVFVAHSMGGLVVKKALLLGKNHDEYSGLMSKVHGIMFLSTPHRGSSHAATLNSMLSVIGSSPKVYVAELNPSSTSIEDINEQFRGICGSWQLVSLYETQQTRLSPGLKRMIVDKSSGVLGYPKEISAPLDADHHTICKYQSRLDSNYHLVIDLLRQLTEEIRSRHSNSIHVTAKASTQVALLRSVLGIKSDFRIALDHHLAHALPGSCQWLNRLVRFQEWLVASDQAKAHDVLWLVGLPGTGKSTLAAKTIDHIQQALHERSCQYHFFSESEPMKRDLAFCLRSIAFQLAITHPPLAEKLIQLHQDTNFSAAEQRFGHIWDTIFEKVVFKIDFGHTLHWVFDGLDEADQPHFLVRCLMQLKCRTPIKILLISRPQKDLTTMVTRKFGAESLLNVSAEQTQDDIEHYISTATSEIFSTGQSIQQEVIEQITKRAQGSFLWTRLALETLRDNWHTQADLDMTLRNVPNGMHATYERMMEKVNGQPSRPRRMALRIMTWVCCSFHPLAISELSAALQPEFVDLLNLDETVEQICGQFLRVDNGKVSLIHATARQFLLFPSESLPAPIGQETGHDCLAIWCLQHLSQGHWRRKFSLLQQGHISTDRLKPFDHEFPLLKYSIKYWAYHVSHASTDNPSLLSVLQSFCDKYILHWLQAVALSYKLELVPTAARYLGAWMRRRRQQADLEGSYVTSKETSFSAPLSVMEWTTDLIHIVGKFGSNLVKCPSSIHKNIPPLCPGQSIISRTYGQTVSSFLTVKGLSATEWDDRLARLALGEDEIASAVRCVGNYFLALNSYTGFVVVWHKESFEEIRRLHHGEWVTLLATDNTGRLAATAGRSTFCVWELSTGKLLYRLPQTNPSRVMSLDFAQSDTKLLVGYDDSTLALHDLETADEETIFNGADNQALQRSCPRFMAPSPDQAKLAIAFPGQPVTLWEVVETRLKPRPKPRLCIRKSDKDLWVDGDEVFNSAERIRWSPDGFTMYILYQDTTILAWDLAEDDQSERGDTGAREMVLNNDGTLLLTSDNNGAMHIWSLPRFQLIYELRSDEFVRDLCFSPDSQRIYDVRGSGCNVWAPDILVMPNAIDLKKTSSSDKEPFIRSAGSGPVVVQDQQTQHAHITALVCDDHEEFFCVGRDDGAVNIHDMKDGAVVRKAYKHGATSEIVLIEWLHSRRFIASADDSSKVIVKRLKIKDDGKWAVFPVFDLRVGDVVTQMLFNRDETLLLISTESSVRVWDIKAKGEVCRKRWESKASHGWLNHPNNPARLIWLGAEQLRVHTWTSLADEGEQDGVMTVTEEEENKEENDDYDDDSTAEEEEEEEPDEKSGHSKLTISKPHTTSRPSSPLPTGNSHGTHEANIERVMQPNNHQYILYQTKSPRAHHGNFHLLHVEDTGNITRKSLTFLDNQVRHLLGFIRDKLAFIDRENWVCTAAVVSRDRNQQPVQRHFFLPKDWVHSSLTFQIVSREGVLLVARNGEVAIVRYLKGF